MQPDDWKQIKEVLQNVLQLKPDERKVYLGKSDITDEIRDEVNSLIAFEDQAEDMLKLSAVAFSDEFFSDEQEFKNSLIGKTIGAYQILSELGTGGMGAVFLAARTDGEFKQKVAIKMLRREFNTAEIRKRFDQEKEIQAALIHPNIARLIDAGTTDESIPYLVMEYIEGEMIDNYCLNKALNLKQRLKLFNKVCDAVAFAHRNLVIHRDLKPSNIIVTENGEPKLLDFGISKLLTEQNGQIQTVTRLGVMTPEYASPEQIKRQSVTTATDIYSLGVILFELLTGHRPFEEEFAKSDNVFQVILEKEPSRPSSVLMQQQSAKIPEFKQKDIPVNQEISNKEAVTQVLDEVKTIKLANRTRPQFAITNPKDIAGDIDNIILKALRKEPDRRYQTVEQFSSDIWRYLDGMPIMARPSTFGYRASKFIKRNKAGVIGGGLLVLAIIIGVIATLWQAEVAQAERLKAENRFNDVRSLANSFLFEITPEIEKLSGSTRAKELVVKRALQYLDNLSKESENDPELKRELAAAYEKVGDVQGNPFQANIGDMQGALNSYKKAENIRRTLLGKDSDNPQFKAELAKNKQLIADVLFFSGELKSAIAKYEQVVKTQEELISQNPKNGDLQNDLALAKYSLGGAYFWQSEYEKALTYLNQAKESFRKMLDFKPGDEILTDRLANTYIRIGETYGWQDKMKESEKFILQGLNLIEPLAERNPNNAKFQKSLWIANLKSGENYHYLEDFDKAFEHYGKCLEISKKLTEADPLNVSAKRDLALSFNKLGDTYDSSGKGKEALTHARQALEIQQQIAAADQKNFDIRTEIASTYQRIGYAYTTMKDYDNAQKSFQNAVKQFEELQKGDPKNTKIPRSIAVISQLIGRTYTSFAKKQSKKENLQNALKWTEKSRDTLLKLKAEGFLPEVDDKVITETETEIADIKSKLRKLN